MRRFATATQSSNPQNIIIFKCDFLNVCCKNTFMFLIEIWIWIEIRREMGSTAYAVCAEIYFQLMRGCLSWVMKACVAIFYFSYYCKSNVKTRADIVCVSEACCSVFLIDGTVPRLLSYKLIAGGTMSKL